MAGGAKHETKRASEYQARYPGAIPLHGSAETWKWDEEGKELRGVYLGMNDGSMGGKLIRVQTAAGVETASAPVTLQRAVEALKVGAEIAIIFTGTQESKQKGHSPIKLFEVYLLKK